MDEPRFVILHHIAAEGEHWDLMLQTGTVLAAWRLAQRPGQEPRGPIDAVRIGDHRLRYLTYEGPLSANRGDVRRVDAGTYQLLDRTAERWLIEFNGISLRGTWRLARGDAPDPNAWHLTPGAGV